MTKAKAITFDPVAHLKTLPADFWVQVPTYNESSSHELLRSYEYVDRMRHGRTSGQHQNKRPDACELYPLYAEFFDKYEKMAPENQVEHTPTHDWVEYIIDGFRWRSHTNDNYREHPRVRLMTPGTGFYSWSAGQPDFYYDSEYGVTDLGKKYDKALKKVANTWNRLRKKARREAGLELGKNEAVKAAALAKEALIKEETEACIEHIDDMIKALQEHKEKASAGNITRNDTSNIFHMTNEMTARNAALRDALGNS